MRLKYLFIESKFAIPSPGVLFFFVAAERIRLPSRDGLPEDRSRVENQPARVFARFTLAEKENERNGAGQVPPAAGRRRFAPSREFEKKVGRGRLSSRRKLRGAPLVRSRADVRTGRIGGRIDRRSSPQRASSEK